MRTPPTLAEVISILFAITIPHACLACGSNQTTIVQLPTFGGSVTVLNALSAGGQLTGYSYTTNNLSAHAFIFASGTMTDLGTLGGGFSQGLAINSSGQVAGDSAVGEFETHAFLYSNGTLTDIGTLGGTFSIAVGINDAGQIAGTSYLAGDSSFTAFVYQNGSLTNLGTLGGSASLARAINQAGSVVGESATEFDLENHAFLYSNGIMTDLGTLGGDYSAAFALNDATAVVGESRLPSFDTHAFVYANGVMTDLGTLGGTYSTAFAVNIAGQIIGTSTTAGDSQTHGFIYDAGSMTDLGTLGGNSSAPSAINNLGQIVGVSTLANGIQHAFLWQHGTMVDLNSLLPTNSGWELMAAQFINDSGRIAGYGLFNGVWRTFVMDLGGRNNAPVAVAGDDQVIECPLQATLDGSLSTDPDGDALAYEWSENGVILGTTARLTVSLSVGPHVIGLKVTDPCGLASEDTIIINVMDTTAPTIICPEALTISVSANCQATVPDIASQVSVSDSCSSGAALSVVQNPPAGSVVGLGQYAVTLTATDGAGNSAACSVSLIVIDTTRPVIVSSPGPVLLPVVANCQASVPNVGTAVIATDNCTAANDLVITQIPVAGTPLGAGEHTVSVTVTDASGNTTSTNVVLNVVDVTAPIILDSPSTLMVPAGANCQGIVPNVASGVTASDNCTPANQLIMTQTPLAGALLPTGQHIINVTVADAAGNITTTNTVLTVADATAPSIISVAASPNVLTPPNHQIVTVTVTVSASDDCDPAPASRITSVTCDEPTAPGDIQITGDLTVNLAASKNSSGTARLYTITVQCTDVSGNATTRTVIVCVPKSNGSGGSKNP